jgi:hypothetical protein
MILFYLSESQNNTLDKNEQQKKGTSVLFIYLDENQHSHFRPENDPASL